MKNYLFRFGIPTILIVMFVGILYIVNSIEVRTKSNVTLILTDDVIKVYISDMENNSFQAGDSICIEQTISGNITILVDSVCKEPLSYIIFSHPYERTVSTSKLFDGNTLSTGYVFRDNVKLRSLLFKRIAN